MPHLVTDEWKPFILVTDWRTKANVPDHRHVIASIQQTVGRHSQIHAVLNETWVWNISSFLHINSTGINYQVFICIVGDKKKVRKNMQTYDKWFFLQVGAQCLYDIMDYIADLPHNTCTEFVKISTSPQLPDHSFICDHFRYSLAVYIVNLWKYHWVNTGLL